MHTAYKDGELLLDFEENAKPDVTSTFSENITLPVHRWFRYSAGFSAEWVKSLIGQQASNGRTHVFDPFAGSGTTLLAAEHCGVSAQGIESHPFVYTIAKAKLNWRESPSRFFQHASHVLRKARQHGEELPEYPALITKCYQTDALRELNALKLVWKGEADGSPASDLTWLALASILRECSFVGTAQWQYILPNKRKMRSISPFVAFEQKIRLMSADMTRCQQMETGSPAVLHKDDARRCETVADGSVDLVITSPPYANNYDYADATRLEMSFFGEIKSWGDLQEVVRKHLIRSCTQHVAPIVSKMNKMMEVEILHPIRHEIITVCAELTREKHLHGGKKQYDTMIVAYFTDLAETWQALRRVTVKGGLVCFVVGDSAPYGVHVPVDRWLGELALSAGFESYRFEKTRDRNTKWKNRKHTVPLHEGRLWVEA